MAPESRTRGGSPVQSALKPAAKIGNCRSDGHRATRPAAAGRAPRVWLRPDARRKWARLISGSAWLERCAERPSVRVPKGPAIPFGIRLALISGGSTRDNEVPNVARGSYFARVRSSMAIVAGILSATVWSATAFGADKVTFLTSWFAQAEHGGFYQAKATGLYEKAGLDVTIKMGGPQVNGAAAAARRRDRLHDGLRLPGAEDARAGPAGHHRRRRRSSSTCRASWPTST